MITKGNLHGAGAKLADYLMTGKHGETAELVQTRGLELLGGDPVQAFATAQQIAAAATDSTKPFFHTQTRCPAGEELTREQWLEVADRQEKRLGFTGQPRIVSFHHLPDGSAHMHVAWFRIDLETMRAIDPGLYKNHLKELSRTLENELGLTHVRNERAADDRTRAPEREEFEESRRLKTDLKAIRNTILDCIHQSDNGKALNAALGAHGLMLANGDRRDCFVVVDQAGGQHALNKRLTGMTLAEIRARLGDIDRAQLPGVEEAQGRQQVRAVTREARRRPDIAGGFENKHGAGADKRPAPERARQVFTSAATPATPAPELRSPGRIASKLSGGLAKIAEAVLGGLFSFFGAAEPKPTPQQAHQKAQAKGNVETRHARDVAAAARENEAARGWQMNAQKTGQQEKDLRLAQTLGTPPTAEANLGRDEHEAARERERGRSL